MMRALVTVVLLVLPFAAARGEDRITIITDAFGRMPRMQLDWGYSALVEVGGRRILFDTGNDARKFEQNVRELGLDLQRLDFVVISHRHGDHTAGLHFLRKVNPDVRIFAPRDEHFGGPTPRAFFRPEPSLPTHMRYFNGRPPDEVPHGSAWLDVPFIQVSAVTEVMPGVRLLPATSESPGMRDLNELALAIETPSGQVVLVGCSHPGVETVLKLAAQGNRRVRLLAGGFHWLTTSAADVRRMVQSLRETFRVASVAPGHCTGEAAFKELQRAYGRDYVYAGAGTVVGLADDGAPVP